MVLWFFLGEISTILGCICVFFVPGAPDGSTGRFIFVVAFGDLQPLVYKASSLTTELRRIFYWLFLFCVMVLNFSVVSTLCVFSHFSYVWVAEWPPIRKMAVISAYNMFC